MTDLPQESGSPEKEGNGHAGHAQDGHDEGDERGLSPRTLPPQASLRRRQSIVEKPTSKEEWDAFVLRYARGQHGESVFPTVSSGDPHPELFVGEDDPEADPSRNGATTNAIPQPESIVNPSTTHNSPSPSDSPMLADDDDDPDDDRHSHTSYAGPANQDPDIPNIEQRDFAFEGAPQGEEKGKGTSAMFRDRKDGDVVQESTGLTAENMRQLNLQSSARGNVTMRTSKGEGSRAKRGKVNFRPESPSPSDKSGRSRGSRSSSNDKAMQQAGENWVEETRKRKQASKSSRSNPAPPPRRPRSRGSLVSYSRRSVNDKGDLSGSVLGPGSVLLESGTGSTTNSGGEPLDFEYDMSAEQDRVRVFYETHGYLPAPRQAPDGARRRLRIIRRLGLENPEKPQPGLQRFIRLACTMLGVKAAMVSIVGHDKAYVVAAQNLPIKEMSLDNALCTHTMVAAGKSCFVIHDPATDWRFKNNPFTLLLPYTMTGEHIAEDEARKRANTKDKKELKFYAGAQLIVGSGVKETAFGSLCIFDDKPHEFGEEKRAALAELATCVVSELELGYAHQASLESAKLHQISVDFLRRSLKSRPDERAGFNRRSQNKSTTDSTTTSKPGTGSDKRKSGADKNQSEDEIDIYDEACSEIRHALDAYAVAIVDLSQFHLFYPTFQGSSTAGSSTRGRLSRFSGSKGGTTIMGNSVGGSTAAPSVAGAGKSAEGEMDEADVYSHRRHSKRARQTYMLTDPTAPSRTPQVLYIPSGRTGKARTGETDEKNNEDLAVLGYSCAYDDFAFNFTSSPAAKRIISDFIAANVKNRQVWYTRDDSEGVAQSINHLMPAGTETSMAMPVFGFDGQVTFAVVACWTDPLYTYPAGAMQFVETIAGSLLASVMKERLHQAERAQLSFAAAASHELRTPLHQITAAATLLRSTLQPALARTASPSPSPAPSSSAHASPRPPFQERTESSDTSGTEESEASTTASASTDFDRPVRPTLRSISSEDRSDALQQLDIIETNGLALGTILENLIDTLDIGRLTSKLDAKQTSYPGNVAQTGEAGSGTASGPGGMGNPRGDPTTGFGPGISSSVPVLREQTEVVSLEQMLEDVVLDSIRMEERLRKVQGQKGGMEGIEVVLEVLPRNRGSWKMAQEPGPLSRALSKIVHNACKFTEKGYIHITVQDVSRDVVLPAGYDNSIRTSVISIDIKDTGRGMTPEFLEREVLRPFSKADSFTPGSGLGLGLAQRMIELLGGKLAIASTPGKGTLVHVEVPMHLYNEDNDSDQDDLAMQADMADPNGDNPDKVVERVRQDGIFLVGFEGTAAIKRVGKSLLRQLKLNFCRVVPDPQYASLIVSPDHVQPDVLISLARRARPRVEIVTIGDRVRLRPKALLKGRSGAPESARVSLEGEGDDNEMLGGYPIRRFSRPLRPSVLAGIMRPAKAETSLESYTSPVVGGEQTEESWGRVLEGRLKANAAESDFDRPKLNRMESIMTNNTTTTTTGTNTTGGETEASGSQAEDLEIVPSPNNSPRFGALRELGPIPVGMRTIKADFEAALPIIQHDRRDSSMHRRKTPAVEKTQQEAMGDYFTKDSGASASDSHVSESSEKDGDEEMQSRKGSLGFSSVPPSATASTSSVGVSAHSGEDSGKGKGRPLKVRTGIDDGTVLKERLRVLVVEDNDVNRRILTTMLKRMACEYAEAVDGYDAVAQYTAFRPHVILLDINMPRKDGFQAAAEIRAIERKAKRRTTGVSPMPEKPSDHASQASSSSASGSASEGQEVRTTDFAMPSDPDASVTTPTAPTSSSQPALPVLERTRIVAVTAMSSEAHRRRGLVECGIDVWMAKPVGIKVLKDEIDKVKQDMEKEKNEA